MSVNEAFAAHTCGVVSSVRLLSTPSTTTSIVSAWAVQRGKYAKVVSSLRGVSAPDRVI
eukprot:SAG31_NODE_1691_length_7513_cov_11.746830_6_plen_59_part_00